MTTNQSVGSTTLSGTGILNLGSYILSVYNNWTSTSTGTFNANTGTVNFAGTNQYIFGTTTFNNLTKTVSSADSLSFGMSTTTITGNLTLGGATGTPLTLQGFEETYVPSNIGTSSLANGVINGGKTTNGLSTGSTFIALDSSGNIYVVDTSGNRIEEFNSSGTYVNKFGTYGSGNGQFNIPYGIAIDSSNNVYVADSGNNRIEEFDSSGNYVAQWGTSGTGANQFSTPRGIGIATSTGNIYVVDSGNNRVQLFNSSGTFISTYGWGVATGASSTEICTSSCRAGFAVASTTAGGFNAPYGIAVNSWGNVIYVTDYTNNRVVSSDLTGNYISKWGTSGSGNGSTTNPYGIAINKNGDIYLADKGNVRIEIFASTTNAYVSKFTSVVATGIAVDSSGNVFVSGASSVAKYNSAFTKQFQSGIAANGNGTIYSPSYLVTDSSGNLYVSDSGNDRVLKFDSSGNYAMKFGSGGTGNGQFGSYPYYGPRGIAIDPSGNILVADRGLTVHRVEVFNSSGVYQTQFASSSMSDIAIDSSGNIYGLLNVGSAVQKFDSSYNFIKQWGTVGTGNGQFDGTGKLAGIAVDPSGSYVYVADAGNNRIEKFDSSGNFITKWGSLGSGNGQFNYPAKVFVDSSGNVYVTEFTNNRIQKFDANGNYITQWGSYGTGNGQFSTPFGVTVDSSGNVYVADFYNNRIQKFHNLWQISATGSTSIAYATVKDSSNYGTAIKCFNCTDGGSNVGWSFLTATAPTMAVATSSNVASTSVTLNSGITSDGNASSTIIGFNYGTSISYGSATSTTGTYGNGYFSMNLTGLPCGGMVYHYQSFATNAVGTGTSSDATFTTGSCTSTIYPPTLGIATSSSVTYTTATLTDSIETDGGSASTIAGFNYGTSTSYGLVASTTGTYSAGNQWNLGVTGLTCSTTYHFQGYATNSGGTGTSSDQILTTATCPLSITSFSPSGDQPTWTYYTTLSFTTNEAATCKYATTSATTYAAISMSADTSSTTHSWPITAISSGHSYTYYPFCKDAALYENPVTPIAFNIPTDTTAPDLVDVSPTFIYFDTAIIQWNTTEPSDTLFEYGTTQSLGTTIPLDRSLSIPHAITLTNLNVGTTYYYKVTDKDKSGNSTSSPIQSFTTLSRSYAKEYFISTAANGGSDSNDGTIAHPFLTLEKSTAAVRTWRSTNPDCSTPVMIWLRGGEYYRASNLYLSGIDRGTTNCPTIFSGYGSENAVITGGKDISGFTRVTDPTILNRLSASAQANVYQVDLTANGITDYGDLRNVAYGTLSPLELFFNGKPMQLARYPNAGDTNFPSEIHTSSYALSGSDPVLGYGSDTTPAGWASSNDIWAHGWFKYDWSDHTQRVKSFDLVNKTITLDSSTTTSSNGGSSANAANGYSTYTPNCCAGFFYFLNVLEALDTPGEYYLDRSTGILYFWPPSDISLGRSQVSTSKDNFVRTYNVSNIIFQNLTFEDNRSIEFYLSSLSNFAIVHSVIHNIGGSAIVLTGGDPNNNVGVYNSHIYDIGSYGITLYSPQNRQLTGGRNYAVNNKVHNTGRWDAANFGGFPIQGLGSNPYLSHNDVYDQLNLGMELYGSTNGIVEYNNVHDVMKLANDDAGIYISGSWMTRGNVVKYNYVHDIYGMPDNTSSDGIYFDDATPGNTAYGNVLDTIAPLRSGASRIGGTFMIGAGKNNFIQNNIVFNSGVGIHMGNWSSLSAKLATLATSTYVAPRSTFFPEGTLATTTSTINPEGSVISQNIFYTTTPVYENSAGQTWEPYIDMRNNLTSADPLFVDSANGNFNLQGGSPAYALGFQDIPFNSIGLMNSSDAVFNEITYSSSVTAPSISTVAASSVSTSTVILNGSIDIDGNASSTVRGFAYGTDLSLASVIATTTETGTFGIGSFSTTTINLTPNTLYYFRAYAVNSAGTSTGLILSTATLSVATVPSTPTSVTAATSSPNQATVSFTPGSDGGSTILYYLASSTPGNFTATSTGSPIIVSGLSNGTAYTFVVYAVNALGTSSPSSASSAVTPTAAIVAPTVTTSVTVDSITQTSATINGNITGNGGSDAIQHGFAWGTSSGLTSGTATTTGGGFSGTGAFTSSSARNLSSLSCGTTYYFRAYATNSVGTSTGSIQNFNTSACNTVPGTPTGVSATAGNHQATVIFTAGSNGGSPILYYLASSTPGNITATSSGSPITVTGLTNGTTYTFQVYAVNAIGTSTPSSASAGITLDGTAPTTVAYLPGGTYGTAQSVTLTCTDNVGGVGCNNTYYSVDGSAPTIPYSGAISISTNTTLKFYSTDLNGNIESTETQVYVIDSTYPFTTITPSTVSATTSTGISFSFVANKAGSTYECKLDSASFSSCTSPQSLSGLADGSHTFTVRATDTLSHVEPSPAFVTWLVDTTAPTVSLTTPSDGGTVSGTSVTLTATNSDVGSGIAGVQFKLDGANIGSEGLTNPYSITWNSKTTTSASHTLAAVARDVTGNYATSSITVTVKNTAPGVPTSVTATAGDAQASVAFLAPADNGGDSNMNYTVISNPSGGTDGNAGTTALTHTITGLTNNTPYTFTVTATNSNGTSNPSDPSTPVTPVASVSPTYTIGGIMSGLSGTVVLQNNSGDNKTISANGSFAFATSLHNADGYSVTVLTQPSGQTCSVSSGSGTVSSSNVTSVSVVCADNSVVPTPVTTSYSSGGGGGSIYIPPIKVATSTPTVPGCPPGFICKLNPNITTPSIFKFSLDLSLGSTGDEVLHLQQLLNSLGYLSVAPTGYFGQLTKSAVIKYQIDHRLQGVGQVGPLTRALLNSIRVTPTVAPTSPASLPTTSPSVPFARSLTLGSTGSDVKALQVFLNGQGFTISSTGAGSLGHETNYFGIATKAAIIKFQEYYAKDILTPSGLTKGTGFFGMDTMKAVNKLMK